MEPFSHDELEGIVNAMSQKPISEKEKGKIPLRPPGNYGKIAKISFSPLSGDIPRPLEELTESQLEDLHSLKAQVEVIFGKRRLSIKELAALKPGSLLPLEDLCDDLVDIYVNGVKIGRGEIVAVEGHYAVKIVSFTKS